MLSKPVPKPENCHFIFKTYFKSNLLLKFLENLDIKELWALVSYTNRNNTIPFWLRLAKKGLNGAFESKSIFKELCEIMMQIAQHEDHNKGVQNFNYSKDITNFMTVLSSLSPRAYEFFEQIWQDSYYEILGTSICLENMARFKKLADSMNYNGPVITMTDNTKLYPRLGYSASLGCIVGSIFSLNQAWVNDYNEVKTVIQNIVASKAIAKQVCLYLLQVPDSHTIAIAANIVADFNVLNLRNNDIENDLRDIYFELAFLLLDMNSLDDQNFLDN
ncbi:4492_t:CDS:2 [Gigaspora margarita]|uniref:4492_t:CDS:1 n=1 Tax=Gigaspora margarita TaxID=4874 RepID=A0ABN7UB81_GIGMA|nr:4492_t:CDS:2 [Gigaspora margarita]